MPLEFTRLTGPALRELPPEKTVFLFPVGPLEDHGPHLPLGLDLAEAQRLCELAGERIERELPGWKAVLMPAAPLGIDTDTTANAVRVRAHVLRDWLVDACRALVKQGFFRFVCFSGHAGPRQLTAIEDAGKIISRKPIRAWFRKPTLEAPIPTLVSASSALVTIENMKCTPFWPDPQEHGGHRDTSIALTLGLVPVVTSAGLMPEAKARHSESAWTRLWRHWRRKTDGYWGNPAKATAEEGSNLLTRDLNAIFPRLKAVWDGTHPDHLFRSWYSVLPPNKSFIRGWILALLLTVLFSIWISLFTGLMTPA